MLIFVEFGTFPESKTSKQTTNIKEFSEFKLFQFSSKSFILDHLYSTIAFVELQAN